MKDIMMNNFDKDLLKMKIIRDNKKILKIQSEFNITSSLHINKIFSRKYLDFLKIIINIHFNNQKNKKVYDNIKLLELDNINLDIIDDVLKLNNVEAVNTPVFKHFKLKNNIKNKNTKDFELINLTVSDIVEIDSSEKSYKML